MVASIAPTDADGLFRPSLHLDDDHDAEDHAEHGIASVHGLVSLLFALNLVIGLLPGSGVARAPHPTVRPSSEALISPAALAAILGRPVARVGRGRVRLAEIDELLRGLAISLDLYRVVGRPSALVAVSRVGPEGRRGGRVAPADPWRLALDTLSAHRIDWTSPRDLGGEAFATTLGVTERVAWRMPGGLASVSVTSLERDQVWRARAAHDVAAFAIRLDRLG